MATLHVFLPAALLLCFAAGRGVQAFLFQYSRDESYRQTQQSASTSLTSEGYTQNAICRQNNCINPVFPGLYDLAKLEQIAWQCTNQSEAKESVDFCKAVISYDIALPSPNASKPVKELVKQQDDAAATMFFYHLSGLGYEASEFRNPAGSQDECIRSIWKLVCFTYFPQATAGCSAGASASYQKPCRNSCELYISACAVECCDESVQCSFAHPVLDDGAATASSAMVSMGYSDQTGPSAKCTGSGSQRLGIPMALLVSIFAAHAVVGAASAEGAASRQGADDAAARPAASAPPRSRGWPLLLGAVVVVCSLSLQGCAFDVPHHYEANWRKKPDYLVEYEFIEPGKEASTAILNSCSEDLPSTLQCSGHGYCKAWSSSVPNSVSFCECDRDWADPECRTRRKSQVKAFLWSLFGGVFGADLFYLGYPSWALLKLGTLGGFGLWWILDVVRTGSGPVYAWNFRVANDLPHWVYVLSTVSLFGVIGFLVALESYLTYRKKKREDLMKLQESEETRHLSKMDDMLEGPRYRMGAQSNGFIDRRDFSGYGATLPSALPNAGAPYAVPPPPGQAGRFAGPFGPARNM